MIIDSTPKFTDYNINGLIPKPLLTELVSKFFNKLYQEPKILLYVNEKKVLLQQINRNIALQLRKKIEIKCDYLHNIYPGSFTNYESVNFKEPESIFLILTKNHNQTQLRLLKELEKTNIKVNVLALGLDYYNPKFNVISVQNIKSLYWVVYTFFLQDEPNLTFSDFSRKFSFSSIRVDFTLL